LCGPYRQRVGITLSNIFGVIIRVADILIYFHVT